MNATARMLRITAVLLVACLPAVTTAQTPVPNTPPKITLKWLASIAFSPTMAPAGQEFVGTVTLLRPAISNLVVGLNLQGATPVEGNIYVADGAIMSSQVTVPAGSSKATFKVTTSPPASTTGPKSFTVIAAYGPERVSAGFTISGALSKPKR